jgi:hypothetical protein
MTTNQKIILHRMDEKNAGAVRFDGRWIFKADVRADSALADRMVGRSQVQPKDLTTEFRLGGLNP